MSEKAHIYMLKISLLIYEKKNGMNKRKQLYLCHFKKGFGIFISYKSEHIASVRPWYLHHIQIMIFSTLDEVVIIQKSHNKHRH